MAARKKTKKVIAKKSSPKKSAVKRSFSRSSENHRELDEKNQLIIIGGVVAIILFILGSVYIEHSRQQNYNPNPQPLQVQTTVGSSSAK